MKSSRRMKRMNRSKRKTKGVLNLTSLMDVFTILVLYLLVNQSSTEVVEPPREVVLPDSVAEAKPRPTLVMMVSADGVSILGERLIGTDEVLATDADYTAVLRDKLIAIKDSAIGLTADSQEKNNEITIMAHKEVPFKILKSLMSLCTNVGYTKISLAVNQKASQS
jgi:biopolymer transport protein ExbD